MIHINRQGFTLIELMVTITIIGILVFGSMNINFHGLTEAQRIEIKANQIILNYEAIRNDALMGKSVPPNYIIPREWRAEFFRSGGATGAMLASYSSGGVFVNYDEYSVEINKPFRITNISCKKLNGSGSAVVPVGQSAIIEFKSGQFTLTGAICNTDQRKILEMDIHYGLNAKSILFNTVNGLVEVK